jgi:NADH-quinone oxidoreductase subunit J
MVEISLFYLFSLGAVAAALGVILCRSAIYSVLSLVVAIGMIAGLFVLLKAFLVATILVLVYAGAILVLFLFVMMLVDPKKMPTPPRFGIPFVLAVVFGGFLFFEIFGVIRSIGPAQNTAAQGTTGAIGNLLFNNYVLAFELTSFLLLAAVVSVVVLAKKDAS